MPSVILTSIWNHDLEQHQPGTRFDDLDDETVEFLIENGAALIANDGQPAITGVPETQASLIGSAGQVGPQAPVPEVTPATAPTAEQIQAELDKSGLGDGTGADEGTPEPQA